MELVGTTPDRQFSSGLSTDTDGSGSAGDLTITTGRLIVDGSEVSASTDGDGQGGTLTVNASEFVELLAGGACLLKLMVLEMPEM